MVAPSVFELQMVLVWSLGVGAVVGLGNVEEIDLMVEISVEVTDSLLNIRLLESVVLLRTLLFIDGFETLF